MIDLPDLNAEVKVWPAPGRRVQLGPRTMDSGGRWMSEDGHPVRWSTYYLEQYRSGDIVLHDPAPPVVRLAAKKSKEE